MPLVNIDDSVRILLSGGVVVFPTETVYGLGAVATDKDAVDKVYKLKSRPKDNPLICHFSSIEHIQEYQPAIPKIAIKLLEHFSPGPLSIRFNLPKDSPLEPAVANLSTFTARIPNHSLTLELIKKLNLPLVGPSANLSTMASTTSIEMIIEQFGHEINILDGGLSQIGLESTILDCSDTGEIIILRPGAIGEKEIGEYLNKQGLEFSFIKSATNIVDVVPGNKYPHYSPKTPIFRVDNLPVKYEENSAVLGSKEFFDANMDIQVGKIIIGSHRNLELTARELYQTLQNIDRKKLSLVYLIQENWGETSLGLALQNRINKVGRLLV